LKPSFLFALKFAERGNSGQWNCCHVLGAGRQSEEGEE